MGISVTADEADRKIEGARKERKEMVRRHSTNGTSMAEELRARAAELNPTHMDNPDPNYAYRLVDRRREGERISQLEGMGYEVVPEDSPERLIHSSKRDGAQVRGDLVLMRTTAKAYEIGRQQKHKKMARMYGETMEQHKENINKIARDGGLVGPHQEAVTEEKSGEF